MGEQRNGVVSRVRLRVFCLFFFKGQEGKSMLYSDGRKSFESKMERMNSWSSALEGLNGMRFSSRV